MVPSPALVRAFSLVIWLVVCLVFLAAPRRALADKASYSGFELDTIEAVVGPGYELDENPEGKLIESIEIVPLKVFEDGETTDRSLARVARVANFFHSTTKPQIIGQELLFARGQPYDSQRVEESARNLRQLTQFSLVLIVPLKGITPGSVRLVVITRDVWSLRLNWAIEFGSSGLSYLLVNPTENNLFGRHISVGGLFLLEPDTYSLGLLSSVPRIKGTRLEASGSANIVFNRQTGDGEGSFGSFAFGQPLYSIDVKWAWGFGLLWRNDVDRLYSGSDPVFFVAQTALGDELVPIAFHQTRLLTGFELLRSFGRRYKYDVSSGFEADVRDYEATRDPGTSLAAFRQFVEVEVPVSDTRLSPFVQLRTYTSDFVSLIDFETLALQEDFRLGPEAFLRLYPASSALGSTRDMLGVLWGVSYTLRLGTGLVRGVSLSQLEWATENRNDAQVETALRIASPRLPFGRIMLDGVVFNRYLRYLNRERFALGGDTRPRGYAPAEFRGQDAVAASFEVRSRPLDILTIQVGLAAFADVGAAADSFDELSFKPSVGLGLRTLIPQANRFVFRVDWGLPLAPGYPTFPGGFFASFGQAFSMPGLKPRTATNAVLD